MRAILSLVRRQTLALGFLQSSFLASNEYASPREACLPPSSRAWFPIVQPAGCSIHSLISTPPSGARGVFGRVCDCLKDSHRGRLFSDVILCETIRIWDPGSASFLRGRRSCCDGGRAGLVDATGNGGFWFRFGKTSDVSRRLGPIRNVRAWWMASEWQTTPPLGSGRSSISNMLAVWARLRRNKGSEGPAPWLASAAFFSSRRNVTDGGGVQLVWVPRAISAGPGAWAWALLPVGLLLAKVLRPNQFWVRIWDPGGSPTAQGGPGLCQLSSGSGSYYHSDFIWLL
ncbi:hypothetical protein RchiOBHm_Chr7g0239541 [Rosa chinensis]|uniref:Uncharacterized protein n=1 Tax=Rosa chinensis TaxID=74649 RepID=A0A2P6PHU1_ROSCH|nr:hypothetical protein RchiOBHm_Chr7g0239541 [Rosa chinensis]